MSLVKKKKICWCHLPVDDPVAVQEHEGRGDFGSVETRARLVKLPGSLNLEHQVSTVHIFHYKKQTVLQREREREGK